MVYDYEMDKKDFFLNFKKWTKLIYNLIWTKLMCRVTKIRGNWKLLCYLTAKVSTLWSNGLNGERDGSEDEW